MRQNFSPYVDPPGHPGRRVFSILYLSDFFFRLPFCARSRHHDKNLHRGIPLHYSPETECTGTYDAALHHTERPRMK